LINPARRRLDWRWSDIVLFVALMKELTMLHANLEKGGIRA
jgi:hypothetical protein